MRATRQRVCRIFPARRVGGCQADHRAPAALSGTSRQAMASALKRFASSSTAFKRVAGKGVGFPRKGVAFGRHGVSPLALVGLHVCAQHTVDPGLVTLAAVSEVVQHLAIKA